MNPQHEIEKALGKPIDWTGDQVGLVECPGIEAHTSASKAADCTVFLDYDAPTIFCYHTSCKGEIDRANLAIRRALKGTGPKLLMGGKEIQAGGLQYPSRSPRTRADFLEKKRREARITAAFTRKLDRVLSTFKWLEDDLCELSPLAMPKDPREDWMLFLGLFEGQSGVIWCGSEYDSGKARHAANFRTVDGWCGVPEPPGNFTCPSLFTPGTTSRSNQNVCARPYLVLESDELSRDDMAKMIEWLIIELKWRLRAVISSGRRSLHAWFIMPPMEWLPELAPALQAMKLDPATFKASQPVRVPGIIRPDTGNWQRLIYFAPNA